MCDWQQGKLPNNPVRHCDTTSLFRFELPHIGGVRTICVNEQRCSTHPQERPPMVMYRAKSWNEPEPNQRHLRPRLVMRLVQSHQLTMSCHVKSSQCTRQVQARNRLGRENCRRRRVYSTVDVQPMPAPHVHRHIAVASGMKICA